MQLLSIVIILSSLLKKDFMKAFYFIQGKTATDEELNQVEQSVNTGARQQGVFQKLINDPTNAALKEQFMKFQQNRQQDSLNALVNSTIMPMIQANMKPFKYSDK